MAVAGDAAAAAAAAAADAHAAVVAVVVVLVVVVVVVVVVVDVLCVWTFRRVDVDAVDVFLSTFGGFFFGRCVLTLDRGRFVCVDVLRRGRRVVNVSWTS